MDLDTLAVLGSGGAGVLTLSAIKTWMFIQTHALVNRAEWNRLRYDVQSKEDQITELQRQLDAIRAPRDTRGRVIPAGQFELGFQSEVPKTQRFGPIEVEVDNQPRSVYQVWYTGEKQKYETLILVDRNGHEKWIDPNEIQHRDKKIDPWWYEDEKGRQVFCREITLRNNKKKTVWSYRKEAKRPKKEKIMS